MNKKVIIGIIIVVLVAVVSVLATIVVVKNLDGDDEGGKKSSKKTSTSSEKIDKTKYEELAKDFIVALESGRSMKAFADKYMDFEAYYLSKQNMETMDDLRDAYKEKDKVAEEKDFAEEINGWYLGLNSYKGYDFDLELEDVEVTKMPYFTDDDVDVTIKYKNKDGKEIIFFPCSDW